jgi:chorismate dehydratase
MRLAAISFLNTAPLTFSFTHAPDASSLRARYDLRFMLPPECAEELRAGRADAALIPSILLADMPDAAIVPGVAIAAKSPVISVLLALRPGIDISSVRKVALDTTSRTSVALTRILFSRVWRTNPQFLPAAADFATAIRGADATLIIGDHALLTRQQALNAGLTIIDLAEEWIKLTGLPFVFAFWAARGQAAADNRDTLIADLNHSRDAGLAHINELLDEWQPRVPLSPEVMREYWSHNIYYSLDADCLAGLQLFYRYAAECGVIPSAPALRML